MVAVVALLGALRATPAHAQSAAPAEALFEAGKTLMQQKRYVEACAKLEASHDLDKEAIGTLLNLALCHEVINKPASAWAEFRQVAAKSAVKREDRVALAREHEAKLFPLLSYVTIVVAPAARAPGLAIELDGQPIDEAAWGAALPVDPGTHVVHSSAPGRLASTQQLVIAEDKAERQSLTVKALGTPQPAERAPEPSRRATGNLALGVVLGAVGIAAGTTGAVFGGIAASKNSHAKALCANDVCPDEATRSDAAGGIRAAKTDALVADVTIGVGAAAGRRRRGTDHRHRRALRHRSVPRVQGAGRRDGHVSVRPLAEADLRHLQVDGLRSARRHAEPHGLAGPALRCAVDGDPVHSGDRRDRGRLFRAGARRGRLRCRLGRQLRVARRAPARRRARATPDRAEALRHRADASGVLGRAQASARSSDGRALDR